MNQFGLFEYDLSKVTVWEYLIAFSEPINWGRVALFLDKLVVGGIKDVPLDYFPQLLTEAHEHMLRLINDYNRTNQ